MNVQNVCEREREKKGERVERDEMSVTRDEEGIQISVCSGRVSSLLHSIWI